MGRHVYENGNHVWKYVFAAQASEQGRICIDYGIGDLEYDCRRSCNGDCDNCEITDCDSLCYTVTDYDEVEDDNDIVGDILHLNISDIPALKAIVEKAEGYKEARQIVKDCWAKKENKRGMSIEEFKQMNKESYALCSDVYFYEMVEAYIDYMEREHKKDPDKVDFYFDGEY